MRERAKTPTPRISGTDSEITEVVDELFRRFVERFGREPGPSDPIFIDPDSDQPLPLTREQADAFWNRIADSWVRVGRITPAMGYAMKRTGRLVTDDNQQMLSKTELDEWKTAIEDYNRTSDNSESSVGVLNQKGNSPSRGKD